MSDADRGGVALSEWTDADSAERLAAWAALVAAEHASGDAPVSTVEGTAMDVAAAVLRRRIAGRTIAEAWERATDGAIRRAFAALRRSRHPLTGEAELTLLNAATDGVAAFDALLTELCRVADRRLALELNPPAALGPGLCAVLENHGFAVTQVGVRLRIDASTAEPPGDAADIDLHPMTADEVDFVRSCLAMAVRRGLAGAESRTDLDAWVSANIPLPPAADTLCFVGSVDGAPVCHATGHVRADEFTGERVVDVIDTFVLPEWKARGLSRLATAALLAAAGVAGCGYAYGSVVADGAQERLLTVLGAAGWEETGTRWRRA